MTSRPRGAAGASGRAPARLAALFCLTLLGGILALAIGLLGHPSTTIAVRSTTFVTRHAPADASSRPPRSGARSLAPPGRVGSLRVTAVTTSSISLSWVDPTSADLAGVMVRRNVGARPPTSPTSGVLVARVAKTARSFTDTRLASLSEYSYALFAYDSAGGDSAATTVATATAAPGPRCTTYWVGTAGRTWSTASAWSTGRVPGASDWACIPAGAADLPVKLTGSVAIEGISNGGSLDVTGALALTSAKEGSTSSGSLLVDGGLTVSDALTVTGSLTTSAGTYAGPGAVTIAAGGTWMAEGGVVATGFVNRGTATVPRGFVITIATGGTITNDASFSVLQNSSISGLCAEEPPAGGLFVNAGTLSYVAGLGGSASLDGAGGCLELRNDGRLDVTSGSALVWGGATVELASDDPVGGPGSLEIGNPSENGTAQEGTLDVGVADSVASLYLAVSSTVTGPGALTVSGSLTTAGGAVDGPGAVTIGAAADWSAMAWTIGTAIDNDGTAIEPQGSGFTIVTGGSLTNAGSFTVLENATIAGVCNGQAPDGGVMVNTGTLTFSPGAGETASIDGSGDCLVLEEEGALDVTSGSALVYGDAEVALETGASIGGPGSLEIGNPIESEVAGEGVLEVDASVSAASIYLSSYGTMQGPGELTVTGALTTAGGVISGPGQVAVATGALWTADGGTIATTFDNAGSATAVAGTTTTLATGGELTNSGTFTLLDNAGIDGVCTGQPLDGGTLVNTGTLSFDPGAGQSASLDGGGECLVVEDEAALDVVSGTALLWGDASLGLESGASVGGPGTLEIGNPVELDGELALGSLSVDADVSVDALYVALPGTVVGAGGLTITASLTTAGGTLAGPGTVTIDAGANWTASGGTIATGLVNDGTTTEPAGAAVTIATGGEVTNDGTFTLFANAFIDGSCTGQPLEGGEMVNDGTFTFDPGGGGSAALDGDGQCLDFDDSGALDVSSGTAFVFGGATLELGAGASVGNFGTLEIGNPGAGNASESGTLEVATGVSIDALYVAPSGTVAGVGNLTVTGLLTMAGGTLAGPGSVTIGSNASWMAEAGTIATSLVNDGTATEPAESYFTIATGGVVTNTASATLQLADNSVIFGSCAGEAPDGGVLVNEGTLTFDPGSGESASIDGGGQCLDLQDEGPIVVASGTALVGGDATVELEGGASEIGPGLFEIGVEGAGGVPAEGALTVESGVTLGSLYIALGGSVVADDGFTVGSLVGQGTLVVSPAIDVSAGSLSLDAGSLSFAGTVELVASGGGDYGELAVDGPVDANNLTLALSFGASPPACDATIVAISAESVTGAFADVTPGAPPGDSWVAVSDPANEPTTAGAYLSCSG